MCYVEAYLKANSLISFTLSETLVVFFNYWRLIMALLTKCLKNRKQDDSKLTYQKREIGKGWKVI